MWERNFEVTICIFSISVSQINVLEIYLDICFKISYDQKCENCDDLGLYINVLAIFCLYQKIYSNDLSHFASVLICGKKLVTI